MSLSKKAVMEITEISRKAETLARGSQSERQQANILVQRIATIRQIGMSSDEVRALYVDALVEETGNTTQRKASDAEVREKFNAYIVGQIHEREYRDFLAGTQSITSTEGPEGGYMVPFAYDGTLRLAMAQTDPIFDERVTDFTISGTPTLQPAQLSGFDLSSVTAQVVAEASVQNPQTIPTVYGNTLKGNLIFKASFAASLEAEEDIADFATKITTAVGVSLARKIGQSVLTGRGGTDISGVVQALGAPSLSNATSGKLTLTDLNNFYFSINRFYRASAKCGWLLTDGTYKYLRAATDTSGRPLLNVEGDNEMLLGKPVYISPSLATLYSSIGLAGALIFGDLSHIIIRASRPTLVRTIEQAQHGVDIGECMYIARMRADADYFDPSAGVAPPITLVAIS